MSYCMHGFGRCPRCDYPRPETEPAHPAPSPRPEMPEGWFPHFSGYRHINARGGCHVEVKAGHLHVSHCYVDPHDPCGFSVPLPVLRALLATQGLALVPAADVSTPISDETLRHLRECALAWEPEARLLGNVTAHQLHSFCLELARLRRENPEPECDNCGAVIDGNQAATSDVCFDCWRSAKERACTPAERAVLDECATEGGLVEWGDRVWRAERARRELARRAEEGNRG
jgi:hypothetical protein